MLNMLKYKEPRVHKNNLLDLLLNFTYYSFKKLNRLLNVHTPLENILIEYSEE